ncbi:podocalyxin [Petaurus breviceps papuanus]|uniref:podocalyxin n=1 Tax=Petaurus breviceps papuanus TaxID=3040969 RepID=UPI0036DB71BE
MRSAPLPPLLLVLLMLPSALGNPTTSVTTVTAAPITSSRGTQTISTPGTSRSPNISSTQPADPSETKELTTTKPTMDTSPQLQNSSIPKSQPPTSTSGTGEQTTKAPSTVSTASMTSEPAKKTTLASSTVPATLGTQASTLPSQVAKSSAPPSAITKDQRDTTTQTPLGFTTTSSSISGSLPPLITSSLITSTPVPGASSSVTSPETTSLTPRTQPTVATSEATSSHTSQYTASHTSGGTASETSGVVPSTSTSVDSENSTTLPTSPYSSHHQPPAMTTSGYEIFSPIPNKITCHDDSHMTENLLILKMTNFSICNGVKDSRNHPLYTALCRAGKANFNKDRDLCHVQLVSQPEKQEVAVLNVSVQTHLQPKELYEVLKKRWDDLKALGVSNMTYGKESLDKDVEDRFSMPLIITIVCMAAFLLLVAALYGCFHQRFTQRKDQQRLTEELQTVENGYHDNPTLEVMETSSEMQEKKVANLNGELGDSWIVPLDNLTKDDLDQEEEDTHL